MKNITHYLSITTSWGKTYDRLTADRMNYFNNRTAFTLFDRDENEPGPFCTLSENHPEISDDEIFGRLPGYEAIIIDNDFLNCFDSIREAKIRIKDNISQCVITGDIDGLDCFYVKCETSEN